MVSMYLLGTQKNVASTDADRPSQTVLGRADRFGQDSRHFQATESILGYYHRECVRQSTIDEAGQSATRDGMEKHM